MHFFGTLCLSHPGLISAGVNSPFGNAFFLPLSYRRKFTSHQRVYCKNGHFIICLLTYRDVPFSVDFQFCPNRNTCQVFGVQSRPCLKDLWFWLFHGSPFLLPHHPLCSSVSQTSSPRKGSATVRLGLKRGHRSVLCNINARTKKQTRVKG